jgi:hypothetical protein
MLFRRRRREPVPSWEVVEYKVVEPVPMYDEDDEGKPPLTSATNVTDLGDAGYV